jgi:hypothetical protein
MAAIMNAPDPQLEALNSLAQKYRLPDAVVAKVFSANCELLASHAIIKNFIPLLALRRSEEQLRVGSPNDKL